MKPSTTKTNVALDPTIKPMTKLTTISIRFYLSSKRSSFSSILSSLAWVSVEVVFNFATSTSRQPILAAPSSRSLKILLKNQPPIAIAVPTPAINNCSADILFSVSNHPKKRYLLRPRRAFSWQIFSLPCLCECPRV